MGREQRSRNSTALVTQVYGAEESAVLLQLCEHTFLTSELFGSVVHVMILETASLVSLEFTKSVGSICLARDSMYFRIATLT